MLPENKRVHKKGNQYLTRMHRNFSENNWQRSRRLDEQGVLSYLKSFFWAELIVAICINQWTKSDFAEVSNMHSAVISACRYFTDPNLNSWPSNTKKPNIWSEFCLILTPKSHSAISFSRWNATGSLLLFIVAEYSEFEKERKNGVRIFLLVGP